MRTLQEWVSGVSWGGHRRMGVLRQDDREPPVNSRDDPPINEIPSLPRQKYYFRKTEIPFPVPATAKQMLLTVSARKLMSLARVKRSYTAWGDTMRQNRERTGALHTCALDVPWNNTGTILISFHQGEIFAAHIFQEIQRERESVCVCVKGRKE
ncbi:hypothetical protein X777_13731 [Ooceraea biroi]|uniref:Uncharacterized protein n=1 Tax=Ooceraea biroi TaxID=2015173 RepID=A0A026VXA6_OOCBI|nr:hypothetical protein X777_13731 [Ooceraea biroi]